MNETDLRASLELLDEAARQSFSRIKEVDEQYKKLLSESFGLNRFDERLKRIEKTLERIEQKIDKQTDPRRSE